MRTGKRVTLERAGTEDAAAIVAIRNRVAEHLTGQYGRGFWSGAATEKGVLRGIRESMVWVARGHDGPIATLRLATKKPWAIDRSYFSPVQRPLYLTDMAVAPDWQRQGVGRQCLDEARRITAEWPADAIFLDAFDADAGAGAFYARCGYREVGRVTYRGTPLIYFELVI